MKILPCLAFLSLVSYCTFMYSYSSSSLKNQHFGKVNTIRSSREKCQKNIKSFLMWFNYLRLYKHGNVQRASSREWPSTSKLSNLSVSYYLSLARYKAWGGYDLKKYQKFIKNTKLGRISHIHIDLFFAYLSIW